MGENKNSMAKQTLARNALDSTIFPAHVEHTDAKAWITNNRFSLDRKPCVD